MSDTESCNSEESGGICYSVKLVNPKRKSDYSVRPFRETSKFCHVVQLIHKLKVAFPDADPERDMGFIEPGHGCRGRKRWITDDKDLEEMYDMHKGKREVLLWCSKASEDEQHQDTSQKGTNVPAKRKRPDPNGPKQDAVKGIVEKLREQLGSEYTPEQYNAWAQLIHIGKHSSYSDPPDFPFFSKSKKKKKNVEPDGTTPSTSKSSTTIGCSPGKRLSMRTEYISQLEKWYSLLEKGGISKQQYEDLQVKIMEEMNKL